MAKSPDAFRTISEVSDWLDTPAHVLRFWEGKFTQIKPVKRAGGRRYYRPEDMALLGGIKHLLHEQGLTIKGAQRLLKTEGLAYVVDLGHKHHPLDMDAPQPAPEVQPAAAAEAPAPADELPSDNVLRFRLDRPATQPSLFDEVETPSEEPAPTAAPAPRALAFVVAAKPANLTRKLNDIKPLIARLQKVSDQFRYPL